MIRKPPISSIGGKRDEKHGRMGNHKKFEEKKHPNLGTRKIAKLLSEGSQKLSMAQKGRFK